MVRFIDREYELSLLKDAWRQKGGKFIVIYGRRRVGKTRIGMEFTKGRKGIFYIAEDTNKKVQIGGLKNRIADFLDDGFLRKTEISEWSALFDYLGKVLPKNQRYYFFIDEFSYIIKNDSGVPSALQKFWDTFLSKTQAFLIVSGSVFGLMSEKILSSASPLYGRRTRDLLIRPLPFRHAEKFLKMPFEEKMKAYLAIGGIPEYLLKAGNYNNAGAFLESEFMKRDGYFYREPYFLLSQEFKEIKTYFTILNAVAYGNTKPTEIANFSGIKTREIYPYLENLIRLGFIKRITPLVGKRKSGIYLISDVFFDFWFNFVFPNREDIEQNQALLEKPKANAYFGKRFEILVREEFLPKMQGFEKTGKWWHKDKEIDIAALNEHTKEILFCECKWKNKVNAEKVLVELKEKSQHVQWNNQKRKEHYAVFAKSFKKKFKQKGIHLYDLKDLEKAFKK